MWQTIIIQPFTNVLLLINSLVHNFGLSIILFTALIRLLTHPLTVQQFKATRAMQSLQEDPRYKKMQEKYKDDKDKLAQEQAKLYKELGISPFGSCLPTLIQFPIIIGLYQSVTRAMAASPMELFNLEQIVYPKFIDTATLLPLNNQFLWMDLGQPERLTIFGVAVPVLAVLVVITTFLQSKLIQPPTTSENDQSAMVNQSMSLTMPLLMGYMAFSLASGLALYFLASNLIGIIQYAIMGRANWSNILPFLKKEEAPSASKPKATIVKDAKAYDPEPEPVKGNKTDSGSSTNKKMRPPRKQKK
ncbi:MAG: membrane protein insertase YidC [Anaerolineaceae bacterium]|nr:membrane protein insertase YidC [Anaerolineaceae bacterium]